MWGDAKNITNQNPHMCTLIPQELSAAAVASSKT